MNDYGQGESCISMKIAYTVFHSPELSPGIDRKKNVDRINSVMSQYADFIDSKVFIVKTISDYKLVKKNEKSFRHLRFNGLFRLGTVGLLFTTFYFYNKVKNFDYDYFIIIEDDAECESDILINIDKYIKQLPENTDILSLYENKFFHKNYDESVHDVGLLDICKPYNRLSTLAYAISKNGIRKYLEYMNSLIDLPIDFFLFDDRKQTLQYAIKPNSPQLFHSDFFREDNGEPIDEFSNINQTKEVLFNE